MANLLPKVYTFPAITTGDTYDGLALTGVTVNGANPGNALSSCRIHFRTTPAATGSPSLELTSGDGDITINNATTWACTINSLTVTLSPNIYYYDWEFTDAGGNVRTYLKGTWQIVQDVTRT